MTDITEHQSKVIDLILEGKKMTEIAKETGIYRSQLYRWIDRPEFKAELETRRGHLRKSAKDKITGQVNALADEMLKLARDSTDQRVKYNAIKYLLDRSLGTPGTTKEDDSYIGKDIGGKKDILQKDLDNIKNLKVIK